MSKGILEEECDKNITGIMTRSVPRFLTLLLLTWYSSTQTLSHKNVGPTFPSARFAFFSKVNCKGIIPMYLCRASHH